MRKILFGLRFVFMSLLLCSCASTSFRGCGSPSAVNPAPLSLSPVSMPATRLGPLPNDFEDAVLDTVLPASSNTFDPFTYGRPGSPIGPGKLFGPGLGAQRCGPMELPMSSRFADPGDSQAVIIISGNGLECIADIDHDKPGTAITFPLVAGIFTNAPWTITTLTPTTVTITNGVVTIRFTYRITPSFTTISRVEYL